MNHSVLRPVLCFLFFGYFLTGFNVAHGAGIILNRASSQTISLEETNCAAAIPIGNWTGETVLLVGGFKGRSSGITLSSSGTDSYTISDFTAGFLDEIGFGTDHPLTFTLACDNTVISDDIDTKFGQLLIHGGSWDPSTRKLTLLWELTQNSLSEQSIFEPQF